jgi:hypothetical protein
VGKIVGRGWAVVEAGPAWFCAKYFADAWGVLDALRRARVPRLHLTPEDEPWVVNGVELVAGS